MNSENYKFFQNTKCEYFPCHKTDDIENFNCLFCYCPLYMLKGDCGGNFIKNAGIKDCTSCLVPHSKGGYERIMAKMKEVIEKGSDFYDDNMNNVVISIDGRKEVHDTVRHDMAGNGSYDKIMPMAKELVAGRNGKSYFVRGTFTAKNKDFSNDVMHLADMGFKEISVEPVVGSGSDLYFNDSDIPDILKEYENLSLKYIDRLSTNKR